MSTKIIRRTITTREAKALFMNAGSREVEERSFPIPAYVKTTEEAEKYYRKNYNGYLITVEQIISSEQLRGMSETDFIKYGKQFHERSKENRGMISKYIETEYTTCLVMTKDRKIIESTYIGISTEKQCRKFADANGEKFIEILKTEKSKTLVCMTEEDFIEHSVRMIDNQHFAS